MFLKLELSTIIVTGWIDGWFENMCGDLKPGNP
jgi:hypothetical protein